MIGKVFPSEKTSFTDAGTGAAIVQYTQEGSVNRTLYYTNRPYSGDGEHAVFLSNRSGRNEIYLLHLKSGKIVQLTDLAGQPNVSSCIHPTRTELYFHDRQTLYRVNWESWRTEALLEAPAGWWLGILNLNAPPWLAFEMTEQSTQFVRQPGTEEPMKRRVGAHNTERLYMRQRTLLYRLDIENSELDCLWGDYKAFTHLQLSPTNPDLAIFSSVADYGDDRCYYLNLARRTKLSPRPIFPESPRARGGHECFTRRGNLYNQWMEGDVEPNGSHTMYHGFRQLAGATLDEIDDTPFLKYELPRQHGPAQQYCVHHFTMNWHEAWGVHDRWMGAPDYETSMSWLSLFHHQSMSPQTRDIKLCFHDGFKGDALGLGANLSIDGNDESAIYTSFLKGRANICRLDLRPFVECFMS